MRQLARVATTYPPDLCYVPAMIEAQRNAHNAKGSSFFGSYLALAAACLLWASSFMAMRSLVLVVPPASVVWMRSVVALAATLPFRRLWRPREKKSGDLPLLAVLVLLQPCLYFLLEANALRLTTSTQAGIVSAVVPVLVSAGAAFFLAERPAPIAIAGAVLSIAGVAGISFLGSANQAAANAPLGNLMEFAAMVCAALYMLLAKRLSARWGPWSLAAWQAAAGFVFFLPASGGAFAFLASSPSPAVLASIVYLGLFVTLGAFGLYNAGQMRVPASRAAVFVNLIPAFAAVLGWLVLGEKLTPAQIACALLVLAGVRLGQMTAMRPRKDGKSGDAA